MKGGRFCIETSGVFGGSPVTKLIEEGTHYEIYDTEQWSEDIENWIAVLNPE